MHIFARHGTVVTTRVEALQSMFWVWKDVSWDNSIEQASISRKRDWNEFISRVERHRYFGGAVLEVVCVERV